MIDGVNDKEGVRSIVGSRGVVKLGGLGNRLATLLRWLTNSKKKLGGLVQLVGKTHVTTIDLSDAFFQIP